MIAQPADQVLGEELHWFKRLSRQIVGLFRLFTGYYVRSGESRTLWRERPDIRRKILLSLAILWGEAWVVAAGVIALLWNYDFLLPFMSLFLVVLVFAGTYIAFGRSRVSSVIAGYITAILTFWLIMINAPVFFFDDRASLPALLGLLFDSRYAFPSYVLWGWAWILFIYVIMLFMPIWMIAIKHGEVYLVKDESIYPEGFRLDSRPGPRVDKDVIEVLVNSGIQRELINSFMRFNGPAYMRKALADQMRPDADVVARRMLQSLFDQAADRSRTIATPTLWVSAMDNERLIWDRKQSIPVKLVIDQLVTKDSHPVKIELQFNFSFDPEAIRKPEFRHGLVKINSMDAMKTLLQSVLEAGATSIARLYFIRLPLRAALTQGSVEEFRRDFPQRMAGFQSLGILIQPKSVSCRPLIDPEVQRAETEMLASQAQALADTARLQALIEKVMLHGVPPELLAGLMFLDQSTTGVNKTYQMISNPDLISLPEADRQQQARYIYQKFQGDLPREMVPEISANSPELLPPGDQGGPVNEGEEEDKDWTGHSQRRISNIGDRKKDD